MLDAPVAQLDRAFGYEPKGREFESLRAHHPLNSRSASFDTIACVDGKSRHMNAPLINMIPAVGRPGQESAMITLYDLAREGRVAVDTSFDSMQMTIHSNGSRTVGIQNQ